MLGRFVFRERTAHSYHQAVRARIVIRTAEEAIASVRDQIAIVRADGKKLLMMAERKRDGQCLDSDTAAELESSTPSHSPNRRAAPTKRSSSVTKLPAIFEEGARKPKE